MDENISIIKKTFEIRTKKYDTFTYYNIYILLITILKNLFDGDLFISKFIKIKNIKYNYYEMNINILNQHKSIIKKLDEIIEFID